MAPAREAILRSSVIVLLLAVAVSLTLFLPAKPYHRHYRVAEKQGLYYIEEREKPTEKWLRIPKPFDKRGDAREVIGLLIARDVAKETLPLLKDRLKENGIKEKNKRPEQKLEPMQWQL
jgi:hypothetical protein